MDTITTFFKSLWEDFKFLIPYVWDIVKNDTKVQIKIAMTIIVIVVIIIIAISNHIYKNKSSNDPKELYARHE